MRSNPTFTQSARRAQIVSAAIEIIAEVGWAQTSIRKIADRVGVAMSAVLYHFGTKDNLVDAVIATMYRTALEAVVPAVDAENTAAGKLHAYIRSSIAYFDAHRQHLTALAQLSAGFTPDGGRSFDELGVDHELAEQLAALDPTAILVAGQRDREFGDFPVHSVAIALRGAINAGVEKILRDPQFDAATYADDLVSMVSRIVDAP